MTYDLRHESWIPWRRRSGPVEWGPPTMLVSRIADDPVVAIAAPRPDFDGALQEFLVGLLTVSLRPRSESDWQRRWNAPPDEAELQTALDALPDAFDLEGDGPRFFQDFAVGDFADVEAGPIEQLLIETPGEQTVKLNKDLFIKRDRIERLGRPAATMALLAMQTYAPAGGQGHRTSLRGGGPLTTLVDPRVDAEGRSRAHEQALWYKLWANVETETQWQSRAPSGGPASPAAVFPWLGPTRVSSDKRGGKPTRPGDAHPVQAYFGLPRRIRLEFGDAGRCDLTGMDDERTITGFRMRNYGVQYIGWKHPLSPHYRTKVTEEWLPVHGQPGGVSWRDWLSLSVSSPESSLREPASAVAAFNRRGFAIGVVRPRLHAFGFDMDNMKARGWTEALLPAFAVDEPRRELIYATAWRFTDATGVAASALLSGAKAALFQSPDDAGGDLGQVRLDLWAGTERTFYAAIAAIVAPGWPADAVEQLAAERRTSFAAELRHHTLDVFDRWCPVAGLAPEPMRRRVVARYNLLTTLRGYSKLGEKLFESLGIPLPGGGQAARKAVKSRSPKEATT